MPFPSPPRARMRTIRFAGLALLAATGVALEAQSASPASDRFDPNADGIVNTLAIQPDGKILMGGYFTQLHPFGSPPSGHAYIARLNHNGTVDAGFSPNANGVVRVLALQPNGQVIIGGQFTSIQPTGGGVAVTRNYVARLNADGSLDPVFNPNSNGVVYAIAFQTNGQIVIGGSFTSVQPSGAPSATTRNHIARFNVDGSLETSFDPNTDRPVLALAVQTNGQIVVGGGFSTLKPNGATTATTRSCVARVNSDGSVDTGFDPEANGSVDVITVLPNGQIIIGGEFVTLKPNGAANTTQADFLARLNTDGTIDLGFIINPLASVAAVAVQGDGKILIGGMFTAVYPENSPASTQTSYVARVNSDGTLDYSFNPAPDQAVNAVAVQQDGSVVLGGYFESLKPAGASSNIARHFIGRVSSDGSVDATLAPDDAGTIFAAAPLSNGQVIVGGTFLSGGDHLRRRSAFQRAGDRGRDLPERGRRHPALPCPAECRRFARHGVHARAERRRVDHFGAVGRQDPCRRQLHVGRRERPRLHCPHQHRRLSRRPVQPLCERGGEADRAAAVNRPDPHKRLFHHACSKRSDDGDPDKRVRAA